MITPERYVILANTQVRAFNSHTNEIDEFVTKSDKIYTPSLWGGIKTINDVRFVRFILHHNVWTWMDVREDYVYKITLMSDTITRTTPTQSIWNGNIFNGPSWKVPPQSTTQPATITGNIAAMITGSYGTLLQSNVIGISTMNGNIVSSVHP